MGKKTTVTGVFAKATFTCVAAPKWLTPVNNLARLFGLQVIPIGQPQLLSKVLSEMTFTDPMKKED